MYAKGQIKEKREETRRSTQEWLEGGKGRCKGSTYNLK